MMGLPPPLRCFRTGVVWCWLPVRLSPSCHEAGSRGYDPHPRPWPREWAIGRTFELTFPLPEPRNTGGRPPRRAKPAGKPPRKNSSSTPPRKAPPKAKQTKPRPKPAEVGVEAKSRDPLEHERKWSSPPERREQHRLQEQERRRRAKALGLCRDCPNPAIPDQTRCPTCANRHRVSRSAATPRVDKQLGKCCSDLRGSEQPAAFQEGIETSSPPGAKEGCQGHLAVGALP